jgi:hypothetical protein
VAEAINDEEFFTKNNLEYRWLFHKRQFKYFAK